MKSLLLLLLLAATACTAPPYHRSIALSWETIPTVAACAALGMRRSGPVSESAPPSSDIAPPAPEPFIELRTLVYQLDRTLAVIDVRLQQIEAAEKERRAREAEELRAVRRLHGH